jgi:hypothetical protein
MTGLIRTILGAAALGVAFGWWDATMAELLGGVPW